MNHIQEIWAEIHRLQDRLHILEASMPPIATEQPDTPPTRERAYVEYMQRCDEQ